MVEAAQAGNLDAMRPLLERYAPPLYGTVILPRVGNAAAAQELLRDTLSTAVEKIGRFTWQGKSIYPWLRQIALNKVFDRFRDGSRQRRLADALAAVTEEASAPEAGADAVMIVEQERAANRARIDAAMAGLNPRYRQAIELRLVEELPREACAERLEVTVGTFDVLLFRAIRAFRKLYGSREQAEV
jgi:RNA polymerase sigma factor (sigma-70 family)